MSNTVQKFYIGSIGTLVVLIAVLNYYAYQFYWYWEFWWFDIIMHTLGGIFIASFSLWYYFFSKAEAIQIVSLKIRVFMVSLLSIVVVGIGWELFEFSVDTFITLSRHDSVDTASDLFFDALGGSFAVLIFSLMYNRSKRIEK
jgi:hypothetical protein